MIVPNGTITSTTIDSTIPAIRAHGRNFSRPDADEQRRQRGEGDETDQGHAGQSDDRNRDSRVGIAAGADDARGAAEDEDQEDREQQTDDTERNLQGTEHLDMCVHGCEPYHGQRRAD